MKQFLFRISIFSVLLLLVTNCASTKNKQQKTVVKTEANVISEDSTPYIKKERKNFFPVTDAENRWVDSIYNQMTFDEKVGQLFMVAAYSNKDTLHTNAIKKLVRDYKIGGLIFFQGGPKRQARLTNQYQSLAKIPLFIGIDAEWGMSMRLDSTFRYPFNMTLGAIRDLKLVEKVGEAMGKESKRMGVHFNFAPVLDINTNPKNPIIGYRSFGENKVNVTEHAIALLKGVQGQGIFSTGKHFPGHGDTSTDSHSTLPVVNASLAHLENVELYPYKRMFDEGLVSVMVAHLNVPSLEPRPGYPTSISQPVVTGLLKKELNFDGLIFTDALNMKGASNFKKPGDIDLEAFLAGNDILLFAENVPLAVEKLCVAYQDSLFTEDRLAESVKKILRYKFKAGLHRYKPVEEINLFHDVNPKSNLALQYELYENAVTVVKNDGEILPIKNVNQKIAYVKLGDDNHSTFLNTLKKYTEVTEIADTNVDSLLVKLTDYETVIIGYHKSDKSWWKSPELSVAELQLIDAVAEQKKVIIDCFAKPYSLSRILNFTDIEGVVVSYQNGDVAQEVSAELLFGAIGAKGLLPVSINSFYKAGDGVTTRQLDRLGFSVPERVGMDSDKLSQIDLIAQKAIDGKMAPGMQIVVARKGKVIYQKAFGYHTYDNATKVKNTDLYDVASLTKVVATLPNLMQLYDHHKVSLDTKLDEMLPEFKGSNKQHITFKELLSHYGRMQAWIPFYKATLDSAKMPMDKFYKKVYTEGFTKRVSDSLFIRDDYHNIIMQQIIDSPLLDKKEYKYSDFTFIILKHYLEKVTRKSLDKLTYDNFYSTLGMNYTLYNPLTKVDKKNIVPSEIDTYFRHDTIQGYVHDMEAAMEGGVAGHAGIFSNAMDMAKMMQLFLQKGTYGGLQYFSPETFDTFNTCHFCEEGNRRGLGYDKPQINGAGPTCGCVSKSSFGHTGFTGTMAWADPETEIVYVFLSNRTYPDSNLPNKLSKENIREDIQKIIQEAVTEK
ncbi:glycoside hydrolase family 3 N-terminal domain-containing protein [Flavobacterium sedimenticola]|uniref:beta-N-acetylhexosaminidase n=1 Tax=Flavobacterium sedimenticola TaxID=3043286 RepID=A0ABT6XPU0_9FLAO|nr:glycoside hydrolase family 3 N-terminal domain-containing protein [Flavobacterium sedimenticola]MDI9257111.1 glycoside hydrolase family 3 N-terminal domain-containing protein [Flavobacterium sedimenticola]